MIKQFIWPIDGALTGITNSGQSGPVSKDIEEVFHIPQSFKTKASLSDGSQLYPWHSMVEFDPAAEM